VRLYPCFVCERYHAQKQSRRRGLGSGWVVEESLADLSGRLKRRAYRATSVKLTSLAKARVLIHDKILVPPAPRGWPLLCPSYRDSKHVMGWGRGQRESRSVETPSRRNVADFKDSERGVSYLSGTHWRWRTCRTRFARPPRSPETSLYQSRFTPHRPNPSRARPPVPSPQRGRPGIPAQRTRPTGAQP
jgi:hypothetical protein